MKMLAGSVLDADFWNLERSVSEAVSAGVQRLHLDVADGSFVQGISFGDRIVRSIAEKSKVPCDVHLMVTHPESQVKLLSGIEGISTIYFHIESADNPKSVINAIKSAGMIAGIALSPGSSLQNIKGLLSSVDAVLVMLVEPGRGGQRMIPQMLERVKALDRIRKDKNHFEIAVDGGIKVENIRAVAGAGADVLVVGSGIFGQNDVGKAVKSLVSELNFS